MISPRAAATQGLLDGALQAALQGLLPDVVQPPQPPVGGGGGGWRQHADLFRDIDQPTASVALDGVIGGLSGRVEVEVWWDATVATPAMSAAVDAEIGGLFAAVSVTASWDHLIAADDEDLLTWM